MERSIINQVKSDIFKELYTIINFYVKKGAKPENLKKFYKKNKNFNDLLEDIKNKGVNLVEDEGEYKKLVREVLNDILDDIVAKNKDKEYKNKSQKMKHIKEFYEFDNFNESFGEIASYIIIGWSAYKFIKELILSKRINNLEKSILNSLNDILKKIKKMPVVELADRFFVKIIDTTGKEIDLRLFKNEMLLKVNAETEIEIQLSKKQYDEFLSLIKKQ